MDPSNESIEWPSEEARRFWAGLDFARLQAEAERELITLIVAELQSLREERPYFLLEAQNDYHIFMEEWVGLAIISSDDRCENVLTLPSC